MPSSETEDASHIGKIGQVVISGEVCLLDPSRSDAGNDADGGDDDQKNRDGQSRFVIDGRDRVRVAHGVCCGEAVENLKGC